MKSLILIVLSLFVCSFALIDDLPDVSPNPFWTTDGLTGGFRSDTLGTSDSIIVYVGTFRSGSKYAMYLPVATGTGIDSIAFTVRIDGKNANGALIDQKVVASLTANTGGLIDLEVGTAAGVVGGTYTIKLIGAAGNGGVVFFDKDLFQIWRGFSQTNNKN